MVFAAYNMQEEEGVDESNYFLRCERFGVSLIFRAGPMVCLRGLKSRFGRNGTTISLPPAFSPLRSEELDLETYLRYVLSQAILRESDKQFLRQRFHDSRLPSQFDSDQLGFWLSRQTLMRRHLQEGLQHSDPARVWEFYQSAHRVYEAGDWVAGVASHQTSGRERIRGIECGVYRTVNLVGDAEYLLFPKEPARTRSSQIAVPQQSVTVPCPFTHSSWIFRATLASRAFRRPPP